MLTLTCHQLMNTSIDIIIICCMTSQRQNAVSGADKNCVIELNFETYKHMEAHFRCRLFSQPKSTVDTKARRTQRS